MFLYSHLKHFQLALSFYTRLPIPQNLDFQQLPQATVYLPLVGWLVGGVGALVFYLAALLWSPMTAVILALIAGVFMTGAFHEDGFADACDGFGGGWGKQRILEIMKDSRVGAYGAIGITLLLLLKISLLAAMPVTLVPLLLWAGHSASRLPPLLLMRRYDYARIDGGKGVVAVFKPSGKDLLFAAMCALSPMLLLPVGCWLAGVPMLVVNRLLGRYFYRHIGGYTGDCLGASQQVAEVVFYLGASALWTFI
ncbi:MAG: adenosylcobinamide-GDP ribazoletransferase [Methylovulum sp.]|uniref:adenosylcobinamide-GDP ribazoletransferase n=1 Tax=Methylovulum sp. TaxID=1916980 RepID=UPI00263197D1|nr:adenosylcobinamide-GDP ribazoletransferase [Methylovulum sp.]MDD2725343.1 adenosylcobinamide-GDP ribazoletransferase [Methylovulum sp.]MDD5126452.1 adenosylcobinamide-GDP ribazoletransferase [Methylovulum sp.]